MLMHISLPQNMLSSISMGWSPVSAIILQTDSTQLMYALASLAGRTGNEPAFFPYFEAKQLVYSALCYHTNKVQT